MKKKEKIYHHSQTLEALLKTFEYNQHWIQLADTKSGLVLTINGVIAGFMLKHLVLWKKAIVAKTLPSWILILGVSILGIYFLFQFISFLYTVRVFFPRTLRTDYKQVRHVFSVGINQSFPNIKDSEKFWKECRNLDENDFKREYACQLHNDALICCHPCPRSLL